MQVDLVKSAPTLARVLQERAALHPLKRAAVWLQNGGEVDVYSYGDLDRKARAVAATLQRICLPGESALLLYPPGLDFVAAFFGCMYAGVTAVPVTPPTTQAAVGRLEAVARDVEASIILSTPFVQERLQRQLPAELTLAQLPWVNTPELPDAAWSGAGARPEDVAFLQFTSGSTSAPKGVMITHANLMAHMEMLAAAIPLPENSTNVSWLPVYHDLGLIGFVLYQLYCGTTAAFMSPTEFLQKPALWLQAISRYKTACSGGPNFAYELCLHRITPEEKATLDLSSWEMALNGAEPVRPETLERFSAAFAPCGFRREACFPGYGLAENTLMVSLGPRLTPPTITRVAVAELEQHRAVPVTDDAEPAKAIVACGPVWGDQRVLIVHPERRTPLAEGEVGEIWIQGPCVAKGYWHNPAATEGTFRAQLITGEGPFLRTGDLGCLLGDRLYVTGRLKDMMIIRGRNIYPQDVERTVEGCSRAIMPTCVAAFSVDVEGEERLVVVAEAHEQALGQEGLVKQVTAAAKYAVAEAHGIGLHDFKLIRPQTLPKTHSGKIQHSACRQLYLAGNLLLAE